jgi:serine/threonine-protein kinase
MPRAARSREVRIGRFLLVREVGAGGMAKVHLALAQGDGGFEKWVALKICLPHLQRDPFAQRLLLEEARIVGRISHPNVAEVYEVGFHDGSYFMVMEYVAGRSLRQIMARVRDLGEKLPPHIASRIVADAAAGLHAAHELRDNHGLPMGVVHRDVSPHNLVITHDGITKVVDFGIAQSNTAPVVRDAGAFNGKMAYMSPEQARGDSLDRRVDVHALGIVLWEMLTGRRLFRGRNELETILNVLDGNVPAPRTVVPTLGRTLDRIVMKALAPRPCDRFATALDLSRALRAASLPDDVADHVNALFPDESVATRELPHGEATVRKRASNG